MLTTEQKNALKKVGEATGVDLLALVGEAEDATKYLEDTGVQYKNHKPRSFGGQFRQFIRQRKGPRQHYKLGLIPVDAPGPNRTLENKLQGALRAASAGHAPDLKPMAKMLTKGRKDSEGALSPKGEELARAVANSPLLQPLRDAIEELREGAEDLGTLRGRLSAISARLDEVERPTPEKARAMLFPGGNGHRKGSTFNWDGIADMWGGRKP